MWRRSRLLSSFFLLACSACLGSAGCRGADILPDLRFRESHFRALSADLWENDFGQLTRARQDAPPDAVARVAPSSLRRLVLASSTGGWDADGRAGDAALQVVLEPRDEDERPVKADGALRLAAFQVAPTGERTPLGEWDVPAEQLAEAWRPSWTGASYTLILPWQAAPNAADVEVVAWLTLADGSRYEARRQVRVRPAAAPPDGVTTAAWRPGAADAPAAPPPRAGDAGVHRTDLRWEPASLTGAVRLRRPEPLLLAD
jgi:hypothetical protein